MIVDDHPTVRRGLIALMQEQPDMEVCGEAGDRASALAVVNDLEPDLLLVDLSLGSGSGDGLELIRRYKEMGLPGKVLAVSIHDESHYAEQAIHAGAHGYVNKQTQLDELVNAARRVLSGKVYLSPSLSDRVLHQVANGGFPSNQSPVARLSNREVEVYRMLGQGLTTREIAGRLALSMKTIETYREHIKIKLNVQDSNKMICFAARWVAEEEQARQGRADDDSPPETKPETA